MLIKKIVVFLIIFLVATFSVADELKPFKFELEEKPVQSNICKINNAEKIIKAGAHVLVAGNTVFKSADPILTIRKLKAIT